MAEFVYILCVLTSGLCAALLLKGYSRSRMKLLLWSGICFVGLAANSIVLVLDALTGPQIDFSLFRGILALVAVMILLVGLVWESTR